MIAGRFRFLVRHLDRLAEVWDRFLESETAQSLIAGLTPPLDCGLSHAGLGELVRQYFRLSGGDGGELIAQSLRYAPMQGLSAALEQIRISCVLMSVCLNR